MAFLNSLLGLEAYFYLPANLKGWLLWAALLAVLCAWLPLQQRAYANRKKLFPPAFLGLFLLPPLPFPGWPPPGYFPPCQRY